MKTIVSAAVLLMVSCGVVQAQQAPGQIQVYPVHGEVYMLAGDGGNITVQAGKEGMLMVDTGLAPLADRIMAEIGKLSTAPLLFIVNTSADPLHTGGNDAFAKMVPEGQAELAGGRAGFQPLKIIAHGNVLNRMTSSAGGAGAGQGIGLPQDEYFTPFKDLRLNGEAVVIYHEPNAHTDGDSIVFFRRSDVIAAGDIFTPGAYPFIDVERGGGVQGEIAALNHILDLAVPGKTQDGGTYVVPGHGRICDEADVVEYRDMVVIVRDRIRDMIRKGMTLEQIQAARPTEDYDTEYAAGDSLVKADQFVESIYKSLTKK